MTTELDNLPPAVRRKVVEADRKIAEIKKGETPPETPPTPPVVVPPTPAPSAPEPSAPTPPADGDPTPPTPTEPAAPTLGEEDANKVTAPEPEKARTDWKDRAIKAEARYATLLGKYNAEVPRLNADLRKSIEWIAQKDARIAELEGQLVARGATPGQPPAAPLPADIEDRYVTEQDRTTFGDEFVAQQKRLVKQILNDVNPQIETANRAAREAQDEVKRLKTENFFVDLTRAVPAWATINKDPNFLRWLTGFIQVQTPQGQVLTVTKQQWLADCEARLDAAAVADVFQKFTDEAPPEAPPAPPASQVPSLESQVVPPRMKGAPSGPKAPVLIKASARKQFYDEVAKGRWASRPVERDRKMAEFELAVAEGRITEG